MAKAGPMPTHQGLRSDDSDGPEHRWKPSIQQNQEQAIPICELDATPHPALQHNQLMTERRLYRWFPSVLRAITIIRPETLVRWHRAGFRHYWRWKSRSFGGRPQIDADLRALIRRMSVDNPLWAAPRIHGELLKLGFEVAQSSVAKYMVKRCGPPSQGWCTFLRNHAPDIAAIDLFVVPSIGFDLLYALVIVRLARRDLVWINFACHRSATGCECARLNAPSRRRNRPPTTARNVHRHHQTELLLPTSHVIARDQTHCPPSHAPSALAKSP